jgi:SAM-dependent methyltransferase
MDRLPLTGERTAPGWSDEQYWFERHRAAYTWFTTTFVRPDDCIVDVGCGEGYGTNHLRQVARHCIGVELDAPTCVHARRTYPGIDQVCANVIGLPFPTHSVTQTVSFQVIEHVWDVPAYLAELLRISRERVTISTPNRPVFSPGLGPGERPTNPFHVEEFDAEQLQTLFREHHLHDIEIFGLHHGERLRTWEVAHGSIIDSLVHTASSGVWDAHVREFVTTLTIDDFAITREPAGAHDLIITGTCR